MFEVNNEIQGSLQGLTEDIIEIKNFILKIAIITNTNKKDKSRNARNITVPKDRRI